MIKWLRSTRRTARDRQIFFTHARKDVELVASVAGVLEKHGLRCWIDQYRLEYTDDWRSRIRDAIDRSDLFVAVVSDNFVRSDSCASELSHALARGKRILPLILPNMQHSSIPESLRAYHWIHATESFELEALSNQIAQALSRNPAWVATHTDLTWQSAAWYDSKRDASFLLRGRNLRSAVAALDDDRFNDPPKTVQLLTYVAASRAYRSRVQAAVAIASAAAALVVGVGALAEAQRRGEELVSLLARANGELGGGFPDMASETLESARMSGNPFAPRGLVDTYTEVLSGLSLEAEREVSETSVKVAIAKGDTLMLLQDRDAIHLTDLTSQKSAILQRALPNLYRADCGFFTVCADQYNSRRSIAYLSLSGSTVAFLSGGEVVLIDKNVEIMARGAVRGTPSFASVNDSADLVTIQYRHHLAFLKVDLTHKRLRSLGRLVGTEHVAWLDGTHLLLRKPRGYQTADYHLLEFRDYGRIPNAYNLGRFPLTLSDVATNRRGDVVLQFEFQTTKFPELLARESEHQFDEPPASVDLSPIGLSSPPLVCLFDDSDRIVLLTQDGSVRIVEAQFGDEPVVREIALYRPPEEITDEFSKVSYDRFAEDIGSWSGED